MCVNIIWWILHRFVIYIISIHGLLACRVELITNTSLTTGLQSDVLLPCSFTSDLLQSNKPEGTGVVWIQNTTVNPDIVEITLEGESKFWNDRGGRIKTFPKLTSELSEFSILIRNVQQSDLGHYCCKLFLETDCLLAYVNIDLQEAVVSDNTVTWLILAAATGGGIVLLVMLITCKLVKRQKNTSEALYENTSEFSKRKSTNEKSILKNISSEPVYVNTSESRGTTSTHKETYQQGDEELLLKSQPAKPLPLS